MKGIRLACLKCLSARFVIDIAKMTGLTGHERDVSNAFRLDS